MVLRLNSKQSSREKALFPHPLPWVAYFVWALCLIFNLFMNLIQFSAWTVASQKMLAISETFGIGRELIPFNLAIILFQFPVALLLDKFGPRRMTSIFIFLAALGVLFFSKSTSVATMWWSLFLVGIGGTVTTVNTLKLVSNWFLPKRFTVMLAWSTFFMILGTALGQVVTNALLYSFEWQSIMLTYGLFGILYAILFFAVVRDSQPGIRYRILPNPKQFKLMPAVKKALSKVETYLIALFCGLVFAQWYVFYGIWHTHFYKAVFQIGERGVLLFNFISISSLAVGVVFFLSLASYLKKRKVFMMSGLIVAIILSLCTIYIRGLPLAVHVLFDCIIALSISSSVLVYTLIYEKNLPAICATVIGVLQIFIAFFRITGEKLILFIFEMAKGSKPSFSTLTVENFQSALIVVPTYLIIAFIVLIFIKETYGKQVYEESS